MKGRRLAQINIENHFWFDRIRKICVHLRPNKLAFLCCDPAPIYNKDVTIYKIGSLGGQENDRAK